MGQQLDLSVIIVNYNTVGPLRACLDSLTQTKAKSSVEVWVVDNASLDESVEMVQSNFPHVRLIANRENVGFAQANNQILTQAEGRYCFLLNPDTVVPAGVLDRLVEFMDETPRAGVVGCAQVYSDGQLQATCHRTITLGRETLAAFGLSRVFPNLVGYRLDKAHTPRRVDWVEGGALMLRTAALEAVGLLDTAYFMYVEDADLCLRMRRAGWDVYYDPNVYVIHDRGQSTGLEQRSARQLRVNVDLLLAQSRSTAHYLHKHYGNWQERAYRILIRIYALRKLSMVLSNYLLRKISSQSARNVSKAYLALLKAGW